MTKKRFKMSMAALGLLAAFFMVLIAVLLAPTLASANKDAGNSHHHGGAPDTPPPHGGSGGPSGGSIFTENEPGHDHGNAFDTPFCAHGVYPCTDAGGAGDDFDSVGGQPDRLENAGGGNPQGGDGWSNGNDGHTSNFWSGGGGAGGGAGGGGGGQGGDKGSDKTCTNQSGDSDSEQDDDKTDSCDTDPDSKALTLTTPGDLPSSDFVDPSFGDDPTDGDPKSDGGPTGDNPPVTEVTVTEVPEPLTLSLFAVGLVGAASLRRRSRQF
jgi:hypothetical protein